MVQEPVRRLGLVEKDGGTARELVLTRTFDTDAADLWEAVTDPVRIPRWFLPVEGELKVGGHYALTGNASGTVLECAPPEQFSITWEFGGDVTWVTVTIRPDGDRATLELRHAAFPDEERWAEFGPGAVGLGWELGLIGLRMHLESGGAQVDAETALAWPGTPEGRAFLTESSTGWRDADIAAGTDAAAARAAADRCLAAYLGE